MRLADFTCQPVDHHRHRVPGIVDEHPVAAQMRLPHGDRQPGFPAPVELAKPADMWSNTYFELCCGSGYVIWRWCFRCERDVPGTVDAT